MPQITEGSCSIELPEQPTIVSKEQSVFYNPEMRLHRDISVLVAKVLKPRDCLLPLAASGIRGIRLLKESQIPLVSFNDVNEEAVASIKKNLDENGCSAEVTCHDANVRMNQSKWEYIDIDPFGSPNRFIQSALFSVRHNGILALTATDTAPLSGTYMTTCLRKYWSRPLKNELMHETGIRILIRKVQMIGMQFEIAAVPFLSYWKKHYFRIFFRIIKSRSHATQLLKQHQFVQIEPEGEYSFSTREPDSTYANRYSGPLWSGKLTDHEFIEQMIVSCDSYTSNETRKLLATLHQESIIQKPYFYDLHKIAKRISLPSIPKTQSVIKSLERKEEKVSPTHFCASGIKTEASLQTLKEILRSHCHD